MDFWQKARTFAEEAAKRSQELTNTISSSKLSDVVSEAAKRSKELAAEASKRSQEITTTIGSSRLSDIVSETAKRSKEIAAEAKTEAIKRADQIKTEAIKRADQIKNLSGAIAPRAESNAEARPQEEEEVELERFGVTEELREFVKEITINTFEDFPLEDDSVMSNVPTVSNVSQDLTEFQAKHASLVLSTVKEISKLRYELCPRVMKERKFWRIYFILVNSHVAPYEKRYMEEAQQRTAEKVKDDKAEENQKVATSEPAAVKSNHQSKKSTSSSTEQDLDVFLLGEESDEGPDDGEKDFDDDLDKMVDSSDDEKQKL
ncbi:hypothetical protein Tsubulata_045292 [Turnera subulata]|uniref:BSD domain-containing protein n=1 Tax=Turnera subulata TaxID=218843 RepID=A0A9Q0J725_9ROSI|nr:hypothetical protein Tsubulata_045292 [Turnera subulata]